MAAVRSTAERRDRDGVIRNGAEWLALWSDPESARTDAERRRLGAAATLALREAAQLAAAARALAADPQFRLVPAAAGDFAARRGEANSAALRARYHDPALHEARRPPERAAGRIFDVAERVRCEASGALRLPGVGLNLAAAQWQRLVRADLVNAHLALLVPVTEALEMTLRDTFLGAADATIPTSAFWMWDRWLRARLAPAFAVMAARLDDQAAYAAAALLMIEQLFAALESRNAGERAPLVAGAAEEPAEAPGDGPGTARWGPVPWDFAPDAGALDAIPAAPEPVAAGPEPAPYRAFTTAFDRVVDAAEIAPPEALRALRAALDAGRRDLRRDVARLAARLQRRLLASRLSRWEFDLEEGLLDAARLDRVIATGTGLAYKEERLAAFRDTALTLLIDISGSMAGAPIEIACVVADMAAAALERCGVTVEVLGFTTSAWRGGASARRWRQAGRPPDPGRLGDLRHFVFKPADLPWRRARDRIAAMTHPDIRRENIDGEALLWAASRLRQRPEARKALLVISDGAPSDGETLQANADPALLDRHLRKVIAALERAGDLDLLAIGVKHAATGYYRNARVIGKAAMLGEAVFSALDALLR